MRLPKSAAVAAATVVVFGVTGIGSALPAHAACVVCDDQGCPQVEVPCREFWDLGDPVLCLLFAALFPPHGDIPEINWDCPPYEG